MSNFTRSTVLHPRVPQAFADALPGNPDKYAKSSLIVCYLLGYGFTSASICDSEPGCACVPYSDMSIANAEDFCARYGFRLRPDGDKKMVVIG